MCFALAPSGPKRTRFWFCSALNSHWYFCEERDLPQNVAQRSSIQRGWWSLLLTRLRGQRGSGRRRPRFQPGPADLPRGPESAVVRLWASGVCHPQERTGQGIDHLATPNVVHGRFHLGIGKRCRNSGPAPDRRTQNLPLTTPRVYAPYSPRSTSQRNFPAQGCGCRPASSSPGRERPLLAQR